MESKPTSKFESAGVCSIGLVILRIFLALIDAKRPFKEATTVRRLPSTLGLTVSIGVYFYRRPLHSLHLDRPLARFIRKFTAND